MIHAGGIDYLDAYYGEKRVLRLYLGDFLLWEGLCTVSYTLDNVAASGAAYVVDGGSYTSVLSGVDGNKVQENSVVVTMGGVDITSTAYDHSTKTITIASVTGNVNITAVGRPYDAEVEYLESNGTPWIDTGIYGDKDLDYEVYAQRVGDEHYDMILGDREGSSSKRYELFLNNESASFAVYFYCGNPGLIRAGKSYRTKNPMTYKKIGLDVYVGETKIGTFTSYNFQTPSSIKLFAISENGTIVDTFIGKIMYIKFSRNGVLVRDYIPVRDNGVGYLYDKVSGQLFGNANSSGAFTYGNDV